MANTEDRGETPAKVAQMATKSHVLNNTTLSLLGVFGSDGDMQALVRHPGGRVEKIKTGERIVLGRVLAIDKDGLMVERNGQARRIGIPGS
jgi:Tfp pilus assembly protein PilP